MTHAAVALYILILLAGAWLAVLSFLFFLRHRERGYLWFAIWAGSHMFALVCEIVAAYSAANAIPMAPWLFWLNEIARDVGQLVNFFAIVRLGFAIVRLRIPPVINVGHIGITVAYGATLAVLLLSRNLFQLEHIMLGVAHVVAFYVIFRHRSRILSPMLRRGLAHCAVLSFVFAPLIGIAVYTGLADLLPLGRMTVMAIYAIALEAVITFYSVRLLFSRESDVEPLRHPEAMHATLSAREWEIVGLVRNGYTNPEIGEMLGISPRTVTNHLYNIYRKIDVRNRVELINEVAAGE